MIYQGDENSQNAEIENGKLTSLPLKKPGRMCTYFTFFLVALSSLPSISTSAMSGLEEEELRIRHVASNAVGQFRPWK
ncbi:hypothetical protein [Haliscomenobacter hydrossis]|uniref:hypothetical protein n=1 Tax=Haliscomenobacter hydrossis TaxID=2350 RepID=UPI0011D225DC|nr:hypothetical protein [Haliscomenobacter hydrossis]